LKCTIEHLKAQDSERKLGPNDTLPTNWNGWQLRNWRTEV